MIYYKISIFIICDIKYLLSKYKCKAYTKTCKAYIFDESIKSKLIQY